jgi:hypothetical protein
MRAVITILGSLLFAAAASQAPGNTAACPPAISAQNDIVDVIRQLFAAAGADDLPGFQKGASPDFYAYDNGVRFTGKSLMDLLKQAHAAGKRYEWSVKDPQVHVACDLAWVTYINQGAVEDASGRHAVTWLESAILQYSNGHWRVRFLHSTRAPKEP